MVCRRRLDSEWRDCERKSGIVPQLVARMKLLRRLMRKAFCSKSNRRRKGCWINHISDLRGSQQQQMLTTEKLSFTYADLEKKVLRYEASSPESTVFRLPR